MKSLTELASFMAKSSSQVMNSLNSVNIGNSTMQDGTLVSRITEPVLDENGNEVLDDEGLPVSVHSEKFTLGLQEDGSNTLVHLTGLKPWTPSVPKCVSTVGTIAVVWDGLFMDDAETDIDESKMAYLDFQRIEVHSGPSTSPQVLDFERTSTTRKGTIETPLGGGVAIAAEAGTYWVALVAANKAGEYGEPSYSVNVESLSGEGMSQEQIDKLNKAAADALAAANAAKAAEATANEAKASADAAAGEAVKAQEKAASAVQIAGAKNSIEHSTEAPSGSGTAAGDTWFQHDAEGNVIGQWAWDGSAWNPAKMDSQVIASIDAGKITSGELAAGTVISAGPVKGDHVEMTADGIQVYRKSDSLDDEGNPVLYQSVVLGNSGATDSIQLTDPSGNVIAGITGDGNVNGMSANILGTVRSNDPDGDSLAAAWPAYEYWGVRGFEAYGIDLVDWMWNQSWGVVQSVYFGDNWQPPAMNSTSGEVGIGEISFTAVRGRQYLVQCDGVNFKMGTAVSGATVLSRLRATSDGSAPSITSGTYHACYDNVANNTYPITVGRMHFNSTFGNGLSTKTVRMLFSVQLLNAGAATGSPLVGTGTDRHPIRISVIDAGPDTTDTWVYNQGGGKYVGGTAAGGNTTIKKTYTSTWTTNGGYTYNGSGNPINKNDKLQQGYYSSTHGNTSAVAMFSGANSTGGESGKTISQAITGATISKVEVYLYASSWYYSTGGTAVIGMVDSNTLTTPTTKPPTRGRNDVTGWTAGQGKWVTLNSDAAAALLAGSRGITLTAPDTNRIYYGAFYGLTPYGGAPNNLPQIRITYTK